VIDETNFSKNHARNHFYTIEKLTTYPLRKEQLGGPIGTQAIDSNAHYSPRSKITQHPQLHIAVARGPLYWEKITKFAQPTISVHLNDSATLKNSNDR